MQKIGVLLLKKRSRAYKDTTTLCIIGLSMKQEISLETPVAPSETKYLAPSESRRVFSKTWNIFISNIKSGSYMTKINHNLSPILI